MESGSPVNVPETAVGFGALVAGLVSTGFGAGDTVVAPVVGALVGDGLEAFGLEALGVASGAGALAPDPGKASSELVDDN